MRKFLITSQESKMSDTSALFAGSSHAARYAKSRPKTPQALVDYVMKFLNQKLSPPFSLAVDVGCGSGQNTNVFAPHFDQLVGIDVSEAQIKEANRDEINSNIQYKVGTSSSIPVDDSSAQLITAACAVHWFDLPEFYKEVERILVPGGVMAIFSYRFPKFAETDGNDELTNILQEVYDVLDGHWHERCALLDNEYKDIYSPYPETVRETLVNYQDFTVEELSSLIQTWSAYQTLANIDENKATETISRFEERLKKTVGSGERIRPEMNYYVIVSRKPT